MNLSELKIVVIGQGYVGLPVALRFAELGAQVIGLELSPNRLESLKLGISYIDDISSEKLSRLISTGRYFPSNNYEDASKFDFAIITVPTPLRGGIPDLSFVEAASVSIAPFVSVGSTVILESTTYPGTTEDLVKPILENGSGLFSEQDFYLGYSPERIDPGNEKWNFENTTKIVSGIGPNSSKIISDFYKLAVETVFVATGTKEAELAKIIENTFRHVNISLVNEMSIFAKELGINIWDSLDAAASKPFGFMKFTPGPGAGGHCLPIDPSYFAWEAERKTGRQIKFIELANEINNEMPVYVSRRIDLVLETSGISSENAEIILLGIAYKKNSGDVRESPSLEVALELSRKYPNVKCVDEYVEDYNWPSTLQRFDAKSLNSSVADLFVILTDHSGINYQSLVDAGKKVFDCRGIVSGSNVVTL